MITGIVKNNNHFFTPASHVEEILQKQLKRIRIEFVGGHCCQLSISNTNGPVRADLFTICRMKEDWVFDLYRNPHCTLGPSLLKMALVKAPQIDINSLGKSMKFFYMQPVFQDRRLQLLPVACVGENQASEITSGIGERPNQYQMYP